MKYGNMICVGDCPCNSIQNCVGIIDLRLTSGKTIPFGILLNGTIFFNVLKVGIHTMIVFEYGKEELKRWDLL